MDEREGVDLVHIRPALQNTITETNAQVYAGDGFHPQQDVDSPPPGPHQRVADGNQHPPRSQIGFHPPAQQWHDPEIVIRVGWISPPRQSDNRGPFWATPLRPHQTREQQKTA